MKKAFVLGGNGFLGYYTVKELLAKGYKVAEVSLPLETDEPLFPAEVESYVGNIQDFTDEEVLKLLEGTYAFVYAAGADERVTPEYPATKFFYEQNVLPVQRVARLARQAGVKKFVLFNSYFSHFAEQWRDLNLYNEQAYPRTRLLQEEIAVFEGGTEMDVMSLRLPYIFGTMPGRTPLWKMFVDMVRDKEVFYVQQGGTMMVTVEQVAQATVGAIENGKHNGRYAIGDTNMKFTEFHQYIVDALGQDTKIEIAPIEAVKPEMAKYDAYELQQGKEHGIHLAVAAEIRERDAYVDPQDTMPILGYKPADVRAAIVETLKLCI